MNSIEDLLDELYEAIIAGQRDKVPSLVNQILDQKVQPEIVLNDSMIPAMDVVGERFEDGVYFVPEMLVAAHSMQAGLNILRPLLAETDVQPIGKVAIGTVRGDIHDYRVMVWQESEVHLSVPVRPKLAILYKTNSFCSAIIHV